MHTHSTTTTPDAVIAAALLALIGADDAAARQAAQQDCGAWNHVRDALAQARARGGATAAQATLQALIAADPALARLLQHAPGANGTGPDPFGGEPPIPIDDLALPAFPVDALPEPLASLARDASESLQVPADLVAVAALGVTSLCLAKRLEVAIKQDWIVSLNLWSIIALPSGSRKTAALALVSEPLTEWEKQEAQRIAPDIARKRAEKALQEEIAETLKRKAAKDPHNQALQDEAIAAALKAASIRAPAEPRLFVTDATPEALVRRLAEQDGRLGVIASEPRLLETIQQYRGAGDAIPLATLLELYGDGAIRRVRITTESVALERPALTMIIAVQPRVLTGLMRNEAFVTSGFAGRVLWSIPHASIGFRNVDPPALPAATRAAWRDLVFALLALSPATPERAERTVAFAPAARRRFLAFADDIERRQRPGGDLEAITEWASKLAGLTARIAGALHGVQRVGAGADPLALIDADSVERAIEIARYAIPHAIAAHDLIAGVRGDPRIERLIAWVMNQKTNTFTANEAFNALRSVYRTMSALNPALALLEQHNYIAPAPAPPRRGRPSRVYVINRNQARYVV